MEPAADRLWVQSKLPAPLCDAFRLSVNRDQPVVPLVALLRRHVDESAIGRRVVTI
jgi:hypothetical protein